MEFELVSSSGKITTICPEDDPMLFMSWLNRLRDIIGKLNLERIDVHEIVNIVAT